MTREQREQAALVRLRLMAHRAFGAMVENRRGGSEEAQKDLDAIDWAIATIQSKIARPQPDPITGLMPCGCGGKAIIHDHQNYGEPGMNYWVGCDNQKCDCTVGMYLDETGQFEKKEDAIKAWNTAMSGGICNHEN